MVEEVVGVGVCLAVWGTKAYLAAKYRVPDGIGREDRWAWKHGTPDWVSRVLPWLEFLGWVVLLAVIASWFFHAAPVAGVETAESSETPEAREQMVQELVAGSHGQRLSDRGLFSFATPPPSTRPQITTTPQHFQLFTVRAAIAATIGWKCDGEGRTHGQKITDRGYHLGSCVMLNCRGEEARYPLLARTKFWVLTS